MKWNRQQLKASIEDSLLLLLVAVTLGLLHHAIRGESPLFAPPGEERFGSVPTISLARIMEVQKSSELLFIDARPSELFEDERIVGSVNLPLHSNMPLEVSERIRASRVVVVYCDGESCDASKELALRLRSAGFTNVYVFVGGLEAWRSAKMPLLRKGRDEL